MKPGDTTRPATSIVSRPRRSPASRSLPASSMPTSMVCQWSLTNTRPPRRTSGKTGFSTEPSIRLHAGRARVAAARGIDICRNVLRFMSGDAVAGDLARMEFWETTGRPRWTLWTARLDYSGVLLVVDEFDPRTWSASARRASNSLFRTAYRSLASRPIFWSTFAVMLAR